ncbi:MAG: SAM-dependent methyltransferase [Euryarchaeota archaeon]|nr:SAM-dependent methyltransferase [Euryarchaeota archaeon]|tara:strand:+ start:974 stop:2206 length:1233 start_codon:yes stop_codon:yes gene_type:complete
MSYKCRTCNSNSFATIFNFGLMPVANNLKVKSKKNQVYEKKYPLKIILCKKCFLLQTEDKVSVKEIFHSDYKFFSQYSSTWLKHAEFFKEKIYKNYLNKKDKNIICEIAANDGAFLDKFNNNKNIVYGIEPTKNTVKLARKKGLKIYNNFFSKKFARELVNKKLKCDLIIANNVIAHIPKLIDFLKGIKLLLKEDGISSIEFQYLPNLIKNLQFDTMYHEHFSYFSLHSFNYAAELVGLEIFDSEEIETHGGSMRVYIKNKENKKLTISKRKIKYLNKEIKLGITDIKYYKLFKKNVLKIKQNSLNLINKNKNNVIGYGASAKGITFINYLKLSNKNIVAIYDKNPIKANHFIPGTQIPILLSEKLNFIKNKIVIILSWNISKEIHNELRQYKKNGLKFYVCIPNIKELK